MSLDSALFLAINGSPTSPHWLSALALFSTSHLPQLVASGAAGAFLAGSRRVKVGVLQVLAAMALAFVLAHLGQYLIASDRPFVTGLGTKWVPHRASHSFPSAHASVSFAFAVATSLVARHWYWALPALAVAALISWSRVYLGLHFPSDILAGAVLGAVCGWLAWRMAPRVSPSLPASPGGAREPFRRGPERILNSRQPVPKSPAFTQPRSGADL